MFKTKGRYEKYDKGEFSSILASRSLSPGDKLNLRNKDLAEIPFAQIDECCCTILALGFNRLTKLTHLPQRIIKLEIKSNHLSKIQNLDSLANLLVLDLSNNRLTCIENLHNNLMLQELHLGDNHIKRVENIEMLKELRRLNLENNLLSSSASYRTLSLNTKLTFLVLKGNPLAVQGKYKPTILSLLPKLIFLDYSRIQSQGFKKNEFCVEFFTSPFFETDIPANTKLDVTPKSIGRGKVNKKSGSIQIPRSKLNEKDKDEGKFSLAEKGKVKDSGKELRRMPSFYKSTSLNETGKIRRFFKNVGIFKDAPNSLVDNLVKVSECKVAEEGETIIQAEYVVEKMILVNKGILEYQSKTYASGTTLFAESLIVPEEVKADVQCKEKCEYYILNKPELEKIFKLFPTYKEFVTKNYLDKKVSSKEFYSTLTSAKQGKPKKLEKQRTGSKSLSKLNLKSLLTSRTSKELGLPVTEAGKIPKQSISLKVKSEIESLFKSADPFDLSLDSESIPSTSNFSEISQKVENLYTLYLKEASLAKSHKLIEQEARDFQKNGYKSEIELIAMERENIRKLMNSCCLDNGENLWMYEHIRNLDRTCEEIKQALALKSAEIREEIISCQGTLQTLLNQSSQSLSSETIRNYKVILDDCELFKIYENPKEIVMEICGNYYGNFEVRENADEVAGLMVLANKLKDALARVVKAQEIEDEQQIRVVRQQLQDQGLLLSRGHGSYLFESSV